MHENAFDNLGNIYPPPKPLGLKDPPDTMHRFTLTFTLRPLTGRGDLPPL